MSRSHYGKYSMGVVRYILHPILTSDHPHMIFQFTGLTILQNLLDVATNFFKINFEFRHLQFGIVNFITKNKIVQNFIIWLLPLGFVVLSQDNMGIKCCCRVRPSWRQTPNLYIHFAESRRDRICTILFYLFPTFFYVIYLP